MTVTLYTSEEALGRCVAKSIRYTLAVIHLYRYHRLQQQKLECNFLHCFKLKRKLFQMIVKNELGKKMWDKMILCVEQNIEVVRFLSGNIVMRHGLTQTLSDIVVLKKGC